MKFQNNCVSFLKIIEKLNFSNKKFYENLHKIDSIPKYKLKFLIQRKISLRIYTNY